MFINNYMIGGDHELFLRNKKTGEVITAEGIVKGTKEEPFNFDKSNPFWTYIQLLLLVSTS